MYVRSKHACFGTLRALRIRFSFSIYFIQISMLMVAFMQVKINKKKTLLTTKIIKSRAFAVD